MQYYIFLGKTNPIYLVDSAYSYPSIHKLGYISIY